MQTVGLTGIDVTLGGNERGVKGDAPNGGIIGLMDGVDTPMEATAAAI